MREASRFTNTHPNTLRKYANLGQLAAYRVIGGQRRFKRDDLAEFFGIENTSEKCNEGGKIIGYCRVSSASQNRGAAQGNETSLSRQVEAVENYGEQVYGTTPIIYKEVGSALNFKRPQLVKMIRDITAHKYDGGILLLHYKDRLCRIGGELVALLCEIHNVKVVIIENNEAKSDMEEFAEDIASFVQLMGARLYSARGAKVLEKHIDEGAIRRIFELRKSGYAINKISEAVTSERYKTTKGGFITCGLVRKYLKEIPTLDTGGNNSIETYFAECIEKTSDDYRVAKADVFSHYVKWCRNKGIKCVTQNMAGRLFKQLGLKTCVIHPPENKNLTLLAWQGIKIKNEKLEIHVITKKEYRIKSRQEKQDNFHRFYEEVLKGKWQGVRSELNECYRCWSELNNVKPLNVRKVTEQIESFGYTCKAIGKGHFFDFTQPPMATSKSSDRDCSKSLKSAPISSLLPVVNPASAGNSRDGKNCQLEACWQSVSAWLLYCLPRVGFRGFQAIFMYSLPPLSSRIICSSRFCLVASSFA
jgi:excisionase family DNA binding protein